MGRSAGLYGETVTRGNTAPIGVLEEILILGLAERGTTVQVGDHGDLWSETLNRLVAQGLISKGALPHQPPVYFLSMRGAEVASSIKARMAKERE